MKTNTPQKVSGYQLTNGEIIEDEQEAITLQKQIDFRNSVSDLVNDKVSYTEDQDTVEQFILCNIEQLKELFKTLD
jgi:hypothetical protein